MLGDKRFLSTIRVRNLLSFGPDTPELKLESLNVLIGPNGSGKSNLIDAISLLQAAPGNLMEPLQSSGGIVDWLCKNANSLPEPELEATFCRRSRSRLPFRHRLALRMVGQRAELMDEAIEGETTIPGSTFGFYYRYHGGNPVLLASLTELPGGERRMIGVTDLQMNRSILFQRKDPVKYPEVTYLADAYSRIRIYREWDLGRYTPPRKPQPTDLPSNFLEEDAANIAFVLNDLENRLLRRDLVGHLQNADESIEDFSTKVLGGTIQLYLHYAGLKSPVPATRLSSGTVRYLCLLTVLCHPSPPPLVCLEEPELGLHPDLLPGLADLLTEASHRMQLIVTTHSVVLVDGLTKVPEAVVVCEKRNGSTVMERRSKEDPPSG